MIVVMAGLPGTGKSTLARELALRTSGIVLNKDEIRSTLFPASEIEYSTKQDDFCMSVLLQAAGFMLHKNPERFVFVDGRPFSKKLQLDQVLEASASLKQSVTILECTCSVETARMRLEDQSSTHVAANRNYDLYLRLKSNWQEITLPKTVIDTDSALANSVESALRALQNHDTQLR
jgi:predicted kinase